MSTKANNMLLYIIHDYRVKSDQAGLYLYENKARYNRTSTTGVGFVSYNHAQKLHRELAFYKKVVVLPSSGNIRTGTEYQIIS